MQKRCATKIRHKAVGGGILDLFLNFEKCRPEVADDVISGLVVEYVCMDSRLKLGDSTLNIGRIILNFAGRTSFTHFCAVFNCIL